MKKNLIVLSAILLCGITFLIYNYYFNDNLIIKSETKKAVNDSGLLTLMFETGNETGEYLVTPKEKWPNTGYTFNDDLSSCENGSPLIWDEREKKVTLEFNVSDKCYLYFDAVYFPITDACINKNMASCLKENYTLDESIFYHDANLENGAEDNSYRYSGKNPNNYVCFGSDELNCPSDNLYRIIGIFGDQIKLIKDEYVGSDLLGTNGEFYNESYLDINGTSSYYKGVKDLSTVALYNWNTNESNVWSDSQLNTINLNTNYLNNIGDKWSNMIAISSWSVGGFPFSRTNTAKQYYDRELTYSTPYQAKIGLMYVSEYGFASSPENWTTAIYSYDDEKNRNNNWLFKGLVEWTISSTTDNTVSAFTVFDIGFVIMYNSVNNSGVRPTFYLNSDIILTGGGGTVSEPYRIS